ncbi:MAG: serine/threonine protein kinase [Pirellulales bacterium]|nr:serine/threonine protein kinase [Pirellulales bacterium]
MNPKRYQQVKEVFLAVCELDSDRVDAFLDEACAGDPSLREEVESLLVYHLPSTLIGESPEDSGEVKIPRFVPKILSDAGETKDDTRAYEHSREKKGKEERFAPGTIIAGRYRMLGLLGRGGMGEVYRADDLKLDQPVALKFLSRDMSHDRSRLERFHNEVRLARKVTHPNVNRVYDIGEAGGDTFISMEYVDGQNLGMLLQSVGRLTGDKAMQVARQLCAGLGAAHDRGVLHLDLKPANIMIDSSGQVCITDFGIASLAKEAKRDGPLTGTPAFMAPELFQGKKPTVQSDLYSLGVVLYEAVIGQALPLDILRHGRRQADLESRDDSASLLPDDVDPVLERVIRQCLEPDPRQRPDSAHEIAASLPGVDPLDEVIAAGETPSPDMVAAAGAGVGFRRKTAIACLSIALVGLTAVWLLAKHTLFLPQAGLAKPPAVLADKAEEIIARLGHDMEDHQPSERRSVQGFAIDRAYLRYFTESVNEADPWKNLSTGRPPAIFFWYRHGDGRLIPPAPFGESALRRKLPPEPGMTTVRLDGYGRLIRFEAIPLRSGYQSSSEKNVDWSVPFELAGLDISRFEAVDPVRKPPMFADRVLAWKGVYEDNPSVPIRIEGSALDGRVVYFSVVPPYQDQAGVSDGVSWVSAPPSHAFVLRFTLHLAAMVCGIFLAWKNLGQGRGDRRGALRLAMFVFVLGSLDWIVGERHSTVWAEQAASLYLGLARITLAAVGAWIWYIALEPHVRRLWPQTLITWSRILQGHFRDPLLGRDILIGGLFGVCLVLVFQFDILLPGWLHLPQPAPKLPAAGYDLAELLGVRYKMGTMISVLLTSIIFGLTALFLMSLFRVIIRMPGLATLAFCALLTTVFSIDSGYDTFMPWLTNAVLAFGAVFILKRVGLVALIVGRFVCVLIMTNPITSDFNAWYSASGNFTVAFVMGLLVWGFYLSLAGGPVVASSVSKIKDTGE